MLVRAEVARAAVHAAAATIDQPEVGDAERAAAGAGLLAAEAAVANGKTCIQVHGGMGFTWEVPAHLYLMRARVVAETLDEPGDMAELVAERY
jgi:alkylation response protein AidB-like acyl-CoA dehydrogenase